jgi:hypothetical protein
LRDISWTSTATIMATTQPLESVMAHGLPVTVPPRAHTNTPRAMNVLSSPTDGIQQAQVRNCHPTDQTSPPRSDEETSSDSDRTLIPDSTASGGQSQSMYRQRIWYISSINSKLSLIQALLGLTGAATDGNEDIDCTRKIKYENGAY